MNDLRFSDFFFKREENPFTLRKRGKGTVQKKTKKEQ